MTGQYDTEYRLLKGSVGSAILETYARIFSLYDINLYSNATYKSFLIVFYPIFVPQFITYSRGFMRQK